MIFVRFGKLKMQKIIFTCDMFHYAFVDLCIICGGFRKSPFLNAEAAEHSKGRRVNSLKKPLCALSS